MFQVRITRGRIHPATERECCTALTCVLFACSFSGSPQTEPPEWSDKEGVHVISVLAGDWPHNFKDILQHSSYRVAFSVAVTSVHYVRLSVVERQTFSHAAGMQPQET
jgi:hypothetical protein